MSYDVYIEVPTGPTHTVEAFSRNYTSNVSWMWGECLALPEKPSLDENGEQRYGSCPTDKGTWERVPIMDWGLRLLNGAPCSEAAGVLAAAVARMKLRADEYRQKEPENGWGNYDGALEFLAEIAQAAADHPLGVIRVSS
jgi:hypothetical protein